MENGGGRTILQVHLLDARKRHTFLQFILCAPVYVRCMRLCHQVHAAIRHEQWELGLSSYRTLITDRQQTLPS